MTTIFEQQGVQYKMQGDYRLPCVTVPDEKDYKIGVWGAGVRWTPLSVA